MANLEGKVALITGAGSGIGRGIAERLASDGADIAVTDMDLEGAQQTAEAVRGLGRKAEVIKLNVASESQIEEGFAHAVSALGSVDIAVANAGIARGGSVMEMSLKEWQDQVDVNLTGVFLTVREAARRTALQTARREPIRLSAASRTALRTARREPIRLRRSGGQTAARWKRPCVSFINMVTTPWRRSFRRARRCRQPECGLALAHASVLPPRRGQ